MDNQLFALKGDIVYCSDRKHIQAVEDGFLVGCGEKILGVFDGLRTPFEGAEVLDFSGSLIIPGLVDLHIHAPQFAFRGIGSDLELLDWLNTYAFPEEKKFSDLDYAKRSYALFAEELKLGYTTRASVFATMHTPATLLLMDILDETGLVTYVGKVNMDRNSPEGLREKSAEASLSDTEEWLAQASVYKNTRPILTPRFVPSCSDGLMSGLGAIAKDRGLPMQSHLSENLSEVAWVKELCPEATSYGDAFDRAGALGAPGRPAIMAHCVYSDAAERALLKDRGAFVAHCPESNTCLASGIAPMRAYMDEGVNAGLGTDVAGGYSASMMHSIAEAIKVSKLRWRLSDETLAPITFPEAFWLATAGGGAFFGKVGKFDEGFEFDALVLDESSILTPARYSPGLRLERFAYLDESHALKAKFVKGKRIL